MPTFTGTAGNDTLTGNVGEDVVLGLDGNDTLSTGEVYIEVSITAPATPLPVTNVRDVVRGGAGNDVITASGINNGTMLYGDDGDDRITAEFPGVYSIFGPVPGTSVSTARFYTGVDGDPIQIFGGAGNDQIRARGHAIIDGGDGDDYITVGLGPYALLFGAGFYSVPSGQDRTIRVTGGTGADIFNIENPVAAVLITDFEVGVDRLNLHNSNPNLQNSGHDGYIVMARQGSDTLLLSRDGSRVFARLSNVDPAQLTASTFLENPGGPGFIPPATYLDLSGPIYTAGTDEADTIQGVGASFMFGQGGNDVLRAGTGNSILSGDAGDDLLVGSAGTDTLQGGLGADTLEGGAGGDTLLGGDGNDAIFGGLGADMLTGGDGADSFVFAAGDSTGTAIDSIADFQSRSDRLVIEGAPSQGVSLVRTGTGATLIFVDHASGPQTVIGVNGLIQASDVFDSNGLVLRAHMVGSDGTDVLIGSDLGDVITGGGGDDIITGGLGNDSLYGGAGADRFVYRTMTDSPSDRAYDVIYDFQTGIDRIDISRLGPVILITNQSSSNLSFVTVYSTQANRSMLFSVQGELRGSDFDTGGASTGVVMYGTPGADSLIGGAGDDTLRPGAGQDQLTGGAGADTFLFQTGNSTASAIDSITDFQTGSDRIRIEGATSVSMIRTNNGGTLIFAGNASGPQTVIGVNGTIQGSDIVNSANLVLAVNMGGSDMADVLIGTDRDDTLSGGAGDDLINGGLGVDNIIGGLGDDRIIGGQAADALAGGEGRDTFVFGSAADSNAGGRDNLYDFETGIDRIDLSALGTTSISVIRSDNGSSFVFAQSASGDFLATAAGRAINGSDFVYGNAHGIYLVGSGVADVLEGSSLVDAIQGGAGNDTLTGGGGADVLFGEGGADTFVYRAASDSTVAAADTVFGFVSGQDRIDLSAVRTGASDTFGIAYANGGSFLFVDLGGNGSNDMLIQLAGTTLVASDIRWSASAGDLEPAVKDAGAEGLPVSEDDAGWVGATTVSDPGGMLFLADGGLASARGADWYL